MAGQGDEWPSHLPLSPPKWRLCRYARMPATARRIGSLPCKEEPQTHLPRPAMPVTRYEISAEWTTQISRKRPQKSSSAAPFRPRYAAQVQAGHARKMTHHTAHRKHRITIPPRPGLTRSIGARGFSGRKQRLAARPRTREKHQGWKPEGPKPHSGFGSRQPGARDTSPRGCQIQNHQCDGCGWPKSILG